MKLARALIWVAAGFLASTLPGQDSKPAGDGAAKLPGSKDCLDCHDAGKRTGRREAETPPPFDAASLHAGQECTACHMDVDPKKLPHADKLAPVECGLCHDGQHAQYEKSLHGKASARADKLAPGCKTCHGTHTVKRATAPGSPTST